MPDTKNQTEGAPISHARARTNVARLQAHASSYSRVAQEASSELLAYIAQQERHKCMGPIDESKVLRDGDEPAAPSPEVGNEPRARDSVQGSVAAAQPSASAPLVEDGSVPFDSAAAACRDAATEQSLVVVNGHHRDCTFPTCPTCGYLLYPNGSAAGVWMCHWCRHPKSPLWVNERRVSGVNGGRMVDKGCVCYRGTTSFLGRCRCRLIGDCEPKSQRTNVADRRERK